MGTNVPIVSMPDMRHKRAVPQRTQIEQEAKL
jgi:hypothetical protein